MFCLMSFLIYFVNIGYKFTIRQYLIYTLIWQLDNLLVWCFHPFLNLNLFPLYLVFVVVFISLVYLLLWISILFMCKRLIMNSCVLDSPDYSCPEYIGTWVLLDERLEYRRLNLFLCFLWMKSRIVLAWNLLQHSSKRWSLLTNIT